MLPGMQLDRFDEAIRRQSALKEDFLVDTRRMTMLNGSELSLAFGEDGSGDAREFGIAQIAHRQLGARLKIPARYYDRLRSDESETVKRLLDQNVNTLLRAAPETRMVRTFGGDQPIARALLSERYKPRDNDQLWHEIQPILRDLGPGVKVVSTMLTDTRLFIKALTPKKLSAEVELHDIVQGGVMIRNSEVGHGALEVRSLIYRLACKNGMVYQDTENSDASRRYYHIGGRLEADEDYRIYSDETLKLDDAAFFARVGDVVRAAVDETRFQMIVDQMKEAKGGTLIAQPVKAIERLSQRFSFTEKEQDHILSHLIDGADVSAWGMMNAITATARHTESYERAMDFEVAGGKVLQMAGSQEWEKIAA